MIGQPNLYISEREALMECQQLLTQSDIRWQLFVGLLMIFATFIIYLLYLSYHGKFAKLNQQVEVITKKIEKKVR